jgi:hypothetical protein
MGTKLSLNLPTLFHPRDRSPIDFEETRKAFVSFCIYGQVGNDSTTSTEMPSRNLVKYPDWAKSNVYR